MENGEYTNLSLINYLNGSKGDLFYEFEKNNQYFNFYLDPDTNKITIQSNKNFTFNNIQYERNESKNNILNKCKQLSIDEYFKSINFNSVDKTLGFNRKAHKSNLKTFNTSTPTCDISCDYSSISITAATSVTISDIPAGNITVDLTGTECDLRKIYNSGDYLEINGDYYRIINIVSKNNMNIKQVDGNTIVPADLISSNLSNSYVINASNVFDLECSDYIILDIPQFHMLDAEVESIDNAFAIIPTTEKCKTIVNRSFTIDEQKKYFNPPLPRLSKINIIFKRYDGSIYNFNGKDHMIGFKITCLNQPGKYNNFTD